MNEKRTHVEKEVLAEEICLRCIFSPLFYSVTKKKIKKEALLPPRDKCDVSLFRHRYMTISACVEHAGAINMNKQTFVAIGSITRQDVIDNNHSAKDDDTCADIFYAPMHQRAYVDPNIDVYTNDSDVDLPAHAELRYNFLFNQDTQTKLRAYASKLVKKMNVEYERPSD